MLFNVIYEMEGSWCYMYVIIEYMSYFFVIVNIILKKIKFDGRII